MSLEIKTVTSKKDVRAFVKFPEKLYKDNPYYVPHLVSDETDTLTLSKNPAMAFCKAELYLAYRDGELVGRVAAIVNEKANERWNHKQVRFGWIDFIDDPEVSKALIEKVEEFGRKYGMDSIAGPLGFTDFDPEGMLVEGFDRLCTMVLIYNHPYYPKHLEAMGFVKEADWIEYHIIIPEQLPERLPRIAAIVEKRANVHIRKLTRSLVWKNGYNHKVFSLINDCYKDLYNYTVMPMEMADKYIGFYLSFIPLKYLCIIENEKDELVAFGIVLPSLVKALQKCRGELFPFGWLRIVKAIFGRYNEGIEMLLVGVRPDYQNTGINSLLFTDLFTKMKKKHAKWAETNAILETNLKNQGQWNEFEHECAKRRRSYTRPIQY